MFCQNCGAETAPELSYCKRCGANVNVALAHHTGPTQISLTKPIVAIGALMSVITLGGFVLLIFAASELVRSAKMGTDPVMAMIMAGMMMITAIDILLIWQMSRIIKHSLNAANTTQPKAFTANTQPPPQIRAPTPQPVPVSSVTENTTRTLRTSHDEPGF